MKILLAEDDPDMSKGVAALLTRGKYSVDTVDNGQDAIDYLLVGDYDAAILDIMMPERSGIEVLQEIRRAGNRIPVLLLTAMGEVEDRINGLDAGADDFAVEDGVAEILTAPESFNEVYSALEKAGLAITGGEITMIPQNYVSTDDQAVLDQMERLVDALEDSDDVQNVYTNLE